MCESHKDHVIPVEFKKNVSMISKVTFSKEDFEIEKERAKVMHTIDPKQEYFVYPVSFCEATVFDYVKEHCTITYSTYLTMKETHPELFEGVGEKIYISQMPYIGPSLKSMMAESKRRDDEGNMPPLPFTQNQSLCILHDIDAALKKLEQYNMTYMRPKDDPYDDEHDIVHGDLHPGNVVVKVTKSGNVSAFLIDFSGEKADDLEYLSGLIVPALQNLTNSTDSEEFSEERRKNKYDTDFLPRLLKIHYTPCRRYKLTKSSSSSPHSVAPHSAASHSSLSDVLDKLGKLAV
jgi:hypothetical protein